MTELDVVIVAVVSLAEVQLMCAVRGSTLDFLHGFTGAM